MWVRARPIIDRKLIEKLLISDITAQEMVCPRGCYYLDSGSSALKLFLSLFGRGKKVGIQAFTCITVLDAIKEAGDMPVVVDINEDYFTTTVDIVKQIIEKIDILVLSHLFGIPNPDYLEIKALCQDKGVELIDDLCQTFHAKIGGKLLEDLSDNYFYSFFYDKPISCLSGGMLKICEKYQERMDCQIAEIPHISEQKGKSRLKALMLLYELLSPNIYRKEFRIGVAWKYILMYYPRRGNTKLLNIIVNLWIVKFANRLFVHFVKEDKPYRLSDKEIIYIQNMMTIYTHNNLVLEDFFRKRSLTMPLFLLNKKIECSFSKRALVKACHIRVVNDMEIGLYNWPTLISNCGIFPVSLSITKNYINIPVWSNHINE